MIVTNDTVANLSTEITLLTTLANALETAAGTTRQLARIHEARGDSIGARVANGSAVDWADTARDVRSTIGRVESQWLDACELVESAQRTLTALSDAAERTDEAFAVESAIESYAARYAVYSDADGMWSVVDWVSEDVVARFRDEAQALALAADHNAREPFTVVGALTYDPETDTLS
jgi:hypothetical protein